MNRQNIIIWNNQEVNFCENTSLLKMSNSYVLPTCYVWGTTPGIVYIIQ